MKTRPALSNLILLSFGSSLDEHLFKSFELGSFKQLWVALTFVTTFLSFKSIYVSLTVILVVSPTVKEANFNSRLLGANQSVK